MCLQIVLDHLAAFGIPIPPHQASQSMPNDALLVFREQCYARLRSPFASWIDHAVFESQNSQNQFFSMYHSLRPEILGDFMLMLFLAFNDMS